MCMKFCKSWKKFDKKMSEKSNLKGFDSEHPLDFMHIV